MSTNIPYFLNKEMENYATLINALATHEIDGIAMDNYQYYHFKQAFDGYDVFLTNSIDLAIGAIITVPNASTSIANLRGRSGFFHEEYKIFMDCLRNQAIYDIKTKASNLKQSLQHYSELKRKGLIEKKSKEIFDMRAKIYSSE